jgi:PTS system nitrogen regulatory IIA component
MIMNATTECLPDRVAEWLAPDDILLDVAVRNVDHAITTAAARIAERHRLDLAPIVRALARREQVGSTGIGQGVALPHARIGGIDRPLLLFMRPQVAIDFAAPDGKPVRLIPVILVPSEGDPEEHLQLLATAAQLFCERGFRVGLTQAPDAAAARAVFVEWLARPAPSRKA